MASSTPSETTGKEEAGNQNYLKRHYFEAIFKEGWSFSGFERDKVWLNDCNGKFFDVSGLSGADSPTDGRGAAFADFDNDGDNDVFVHTIQGQRHLLFRNDAGSRGRFLRVELEGSRSNRGGVGAVVTVTVAGRKLARLRSAGSGFLSSHDPRLLFGLGRSESAERVEIDWPSGEKQVFEKVASNTGIRVKEGESRYETVRPKRFRFADPGPEPSEGPLLAEGDVFPDFSLATPAGERRSISQIRGDGKPALVNLWATWCVPCQHEMPILQTLAQKYASCLPVVGISLDVEDVAKVGPFLAEKGITYPVLLAEKDTPTKVFPEDKVSLPASFLVDGRGRVKSVYLGGSDATLRRLERDIAGICGVK